jgi:hypothetical protein
MGTSLLAAVAGAHMDLLAYFRRVTESNAQANVLILLVASRYPGKYPPGRSAFLIRAETAVRYHRKRSGIYGGRF